MLGILFIAITGFACQPKPSARAELVRLQTLVDQAIEVIEKCDEQVRQECLGIKKGEERQPYVLEILKDEKRLLSCAEKRMEQCRTREFLRAQFPDAEKIEVVSQLRSITWTYPWGMCKFEGIPPSLEFEQDEITCSSARKPIQYNRVISVFVNVPVPRYTMGKRTCIAGNDDDAVAVCRQETQDKNPRVKTISGNQQFVYTY